MTFWLNFSDPHPRPSEPSGSPESPQSPAGSGDRTPSLPPSPASLFTEPEDLPDAPADSRTPETSGLAKLSGEPEESIGDAIDPAVAEASLAFAHPSHADAESRSDEASGTATSGGSISKGVTSGGITSGGDRIPRIVSWSISIVAHMGLIVVAIFVVWSVRNLNEAKDVVVPLVRLSQTPGVPLQVQVQPRVEAPPATPAPAPSPTPEPAPAEAAAAVDVEVAGLSEPVAGGPSFALDVADAAQFDTNFLGSGGNARNIVFLVDASGSLIADLPLVQKELQKSIRELTEKQRFTVLFFKAEGVLEAEPRGMLHASADVKARRIAWIDPRANNVIAAGRGDTGGAIVEALKRKPDLIFLLSDNITGSGRWAVDQQNLLESIRRSNTAQTKINTLQFYYRDPLENLEAGRKGTMQLIAETTGGQYTFVDDPTLNFE